ncbi:hypothetical protein GGQ54_002078 [Naumannella cuiyingiana]|uniref:Ribbon-helix-helix protein CopG domain-containing protein n=1 Tax=Naumannella cuiyingiana TaxID=1347891 RepID=A0A7Z0DA57_9ACTN|nr:ribbon-helix-helix protein, CopG family [Naumannella cuiyingiana]NYI71518.1 hypothetical protein [Naumannella cuiyingiana]
MITKGQPYRDAGDVDLDTEDYTYAGQPLTEARAAEVGEAAIDRARRGRPSLTGGRVHSPQVAFRVPQPIKDRLAQAARDEHRTEAAIMRDALEAYLSAR